MQGVKDGYVKALISPEHWLKGYLAVKLHGRREARGQGRCPRACGTPAR